MNSVDRDIFMLGSLAFMEASSEDRDGIRAQIHSVINRFKAGKWYSRKSISATIFVPYAYSALNTKDPNRVRCMETPMTDQVMMICFEEATDALNGFTVDPTDGATHYYAAGSPEPDWVSGLSPLGIRLSPPAVFCCQIGKHRFYKSVQ